MARAVASELKAETSAGRLMVELLANCMAVRLLQNYVRTPAAKSRTALPKGGLDRRRLSLRVLDYIAANLEGDLTIDRMASIACLSRYHFGRAFRQAVGQSPHRYVSAKRLERAKAMLISERSTVGRHCALVEVFLPGQLHASIQASDRSGTQPISSNSRGSRVKMAVALLAIVSARIFAAHIFDALRVQPGYGVLPPEMARPLSTAANDKATAHNAKPATDRSIISDNTNRNQI